MQEVPIQKALGLPLGHDITEIDPSKGLKRRAFRRGHIIQEEDVERLRNLGKNAVFVMDDKEGECVHEDDAAMEIAPLIAGENIEFDRRPVEGKVNFVAAIGGLFQVDAERLYRINSLEIPSLPTLHGNMRVEKGKRVAAFRIIPLTCARTVIDKVKEWLRTPLLRVKPFVLRRAAVIVTGNEVAEGRIQDGFIPVMKKKAAEYGLEIGATTILPDNREQIARAVEEFARTCDILFVTGGSSVDPDDVTVAAMQEAGVAIDVKGNPLQPGNNLTIGHKGKTVVCAVPAAALFFKVTALDVFLPRLMAGERIGREELFRLGHGGLCHFCGECRFPVCPFGK